MTDESCAERLLLSVELGRFLEMFAVLEITDWSWGNIDDRRDRGLSNSCLQCVDDGLLLD